MELLLRFGQWKEQNFLIFNEKAKRHQLASTQNVNEKKIAPGGENESKTTTKSFENSERGTRSRMDDSQTDVDDEKEEERREATEWTSKWQRRSEQKKQRAKRNDKRGAHRQRIKSARYISNECFDGFICWNNMKKSDASTCNATQPNGSALIANILIWFFFLFFFFYSISTYL